VKSWFAKGPFRKLGIFPAIKSKKFLVHSVENTQFLDPFSSLIFSTSATITRQVVITCLIYYLPLELVHLTRNIYIVMTKKIFPFIYYYVERIKGGIMEVHVIKLIINGNERVSENVFVR
jgi:hypothetical protein